MKARLQRILLTTSCVCALVGLALMVWSVLDPRPVPVIAAMSLGQAIGTLSLVLFGIVVALDVRRALDEDPPKS